MGLSQHHAGQSRQSPEGLGHEAGAHTLWQLAGLLQSVQGAVTRRAESASTTGQQVLMSFAHANGSAVQEKFKAHILHVSKRSCLLHLPMHCCTR